jgi:hypothetical protein
MGIKPVASWSDDEVATWLHCIGLDDKIDAFKANAVDGSLLLTLDKQDLTTDLGLSGLQAKKLLQELEFPKSLSEGGSGGDLSEGMQQLQIDNKGLEEQIKEKDAKIEKLEKELAALRPPPPAPAPAPAPKAAPPPRQGAPVLQGAARGAATGVVKGAISKRLAHVVLNIRCHNISDQILSFFYSWCNCSWSFCGDRSQSRRRSWSRRWRNGRNRSQEENEALKAKPLLGSLKDKRVLVVTMNHFY